MPLFCLHSESIFALDIELWVDSFFCYFKHGYFTFWPLPPLMWSPRESKCCSPGVPSALLRCRLGLPPALAVRLPQRGNLFTPLALCCASWICKSVFHYIWKTVSRLFSKIFGLLLCLFPRLQLHTWHTTRLHLAACERACAPSPAPAPNVFLSSSHQVTPTHLPRLRSGDFVLYGDFWF